MHPPLSAVSWGLLYRCCITIHHSRCIDGAQAGWAGRFPQSKPLALLQGYDHCGRNRGQWLGGIIVQRWVSSSPLRRHHRHRCHRPRHRRRHRRSRRLHRPPLLAPCPPMIPRSRRVCGEGPSHQPPCRRPRLSAAASSLAAAPTATVIALAAPNTTVAAAAATLLPPPAPSPCLLPPPSVTAPP